MFALYSDFAYCLRPSVMQHLNFSPPIPYPTFLLVHRLVCRAPLLFDERGDELAGRAERHTSGGDAT